MRRYEAFVAMGGREDLHAHGLGDLRQAAPDRLKGVSDIIDRVDNIVLLVSESQPRRNEQGQSQRIEIAKWIHAAKTRDAERELKPHRIVWDSINALYIPQDGEGWAPPIEH